MKTFECSIEIKAKDLQEAESIFYDLTKHWNNSKNPRVYQKFDTQNGYSAAQIAELDRLNGRTSKAEREK